MTEETETCPICDDNFIVNKKIVKCEFCKDLYHNMCVQLKDTVSRSVNDCENMMWFCDGCIRVVSQNLLILHKISRMEQNIDTVLKAVSYLKSFECQPAANSKITYDKQKTYAKVTKEGIVVVKPTKACESEETKRIIKQQINPAELGIGIKGMKEAREGTVIIQCRDEHEAKILKDNLEPKIAQNFLTSMPSKRNPLIKIVGIEKKYEGETLVERLKQQNSDIITENSKIKLIISKKMVKTYFALIECDPITFKNVMDLGEGRLYVECRTCRCYEYIRTIRCYNCNQYNHTSKDCKMEHDTRAAQLKKYIV